MPRDTPGRHFLRVFRKYKWSAIRKTENKTSYSILSLYLHAAPCYSWDSCSQVSDTSAFFTSCQCQCQCCFHCHRVSYFSRSQLFFQWMALGWCISTWSVSQRLGRHQGDTKSIAGQSAKLPGTAKNLGKYTMKYFYYKCSG